MQLQGENILTYIYFKMNVVHLIEKKFINLLIGKHCAD